MWLPQINHKHCNFLQVAVKRADRTRAEALGQTPRSRRGRSLCKHGRPHGLGLPAVLSLAPGGRQVDTVNTQYMLKHGENYKNRPKKQKIQGAKYKKLFFPQNVKIPEIRKFTTNWHPCIIKKDEMEE